MPRGHPGVANDWPPKDGGLTQAQRDFVEAFLGPAKLDPSVAYRMAYPGTSLRMAKEHGHRTASLPAVAELIAKRKAEMHAQEGITQEEWLRDCLELRDMCMGRKPMPMATFYEGELVTGKAHRLDPGGAKSALELLGRHLGAFNDKLKVEGDRGALFVLNLGGEPRGNTYEHEPELIESSDANAPETPAD